MTTSPALSPALAAGLSVDDRDDLGPVLLGRSPGDAEVAVAAGLRPRRAHADLLRLDDREDDLRVLAVLVQADPAELAGRAGPWSSFLKVLPPSVVLYRPPPRPPLLGRVVRRRTGRARRS